MKIVQYMLGIRNVDGGVVRAFVDLCCVLAERGHEVVCMTVDDRDAARDWDGRDGRPKLVALQPSRLLPMLLDRAAMKQARAFVDRADVVHLHVPWDPICVQLARLCRRMKIPYIVTLHGMLDDWTISHRSGKKRAYLAIGGRSMLEQAACVQCTAEIEKEQSAKRYPRGRTVVAPLPFDLTPYENLPGPRLAREKFATALNNQDPTWLFVGRLHPIKRIELLLRACRQLADEGSACRALIAGSGEPTYEQHLRELAKSLGLSDRVSFLGFISGQEKISLYQSVHGVALPSAHESFGYSAIEALASGTPVIATKAVNIWQELQSSGGACIVEPNVHAMSNAMATLSSNDSHRNQMGRAGREWVFATLDRIRIVEQYEQMYANARDV